MGSRMGKLLEEYLVMFTKILRDFKSQGVIKSYGLIGGIAVGAIAVPRATKNVDFLVSAKNPIKFYNHFKKLSSKKGCSTEFKKPEGNIFPYYAILCSSREKDRKPRIADVLISTMKWQDEISKYTINVDFAGHSIPVVNTEGLIILKLKSGSPADLLDVENLLGAVDLNKIDRKRLVNWAKRAGVDRLLNKMLKSSNKKRR